MSRDILETLKEERAKNVELRKIARALINAIRTGNNLAAVVDQCERRLSLVQ